MTKVNHFVEVVIYSELTSKNTLCVCMCNMNSLQVHCLNSIWHWLLNWRPEIGLACSDPHLAVSIGLILVWVHQRSTEIHSKALV